MSRSLLRRLKKLESRSEAAWRALHAGAPCDTCGHGIGEPRYKVSWPGEEDEQDERPCPACGRAKRVVRLVFDSELSPR